MNRRQASIGPDRDLTVVVGAVDTGFPNWLDTAGRDAGVLQFRWIGGSRPPELSVTKVPATDQARLCKPVGAISPEHRIEAIRQRQIGSQLRSSW